MGFMDEVSAFTKGVGQKAKGGYDIVNMNTKVSSLSKEIRSLLLQIGETYYAVHKEAPEDIFAEQVRKIQNLEEQIAETQRQIEATKSSTLSAPLRTSPVPSADGSNGFCAGCGAPLPPDSAFCVKCGTKVEQASVSDHRKEGV